MDASHMLNNRKLYEELDKMAQHTPTLEEMDAVYDCYVKPLEQEHPGEFVAVAPDGRTVIGARPGEVGRQAKQKFGPGNFVFKVGPRVVGRWL